MPKVSDFSKVKVTFYPIVGSVEKQFDNLLETLSWIQQNRPEPNQVYEWLRATYNLSHYFARDIYTVLFISSGLVIVENKKCLLTTAGKVVLRTSSPSSLLEVFEKSFAGVAGFLEVLRSKSHIKSTELVNIWYDLVKNRFPRIQGWSRKTLTNQSRHRIDWLRAMGFIKFENAVYFLTESGWQFVLQHPPELIAIQNHEIKKEEKQILNIVNEEFKPFEVADKVYSLRKFFARDRAFRKIVTSQYEYHCAVCSIKLPTPRGVYLAEAAHIIPKHSHGSDDPRNGICLCGNCHWAFDEGVISIIPKSFSITTASYLEKAQKDSSIQDILRYKNRKIRPVVNENYSPSKTALEWHYEQIFLG